MFKVPTYLRPQAIKFEQLGTKPTRQFVLKSGWPEKRKVKQHEKEMKETLGPRTRPIESKARTVRHRLSSYGTYIGKAGTEDRHCTYTLYN